MEEQSVVFLIGPPSIGKSTYIKSAFDPSNTIVISRDDIVQATASSHGLQYDDLFEYPPKDLILNLNTKINSTLYSSFESALSSGKNVVIDMTNMSKYVRNKFIELINPGIKKIAVVFNFSDSDTLDIIKKVAEKRRLEDLKKGLKKTIPLNVFEKMINNYEPPTKSEGFDEIKYIDTLPQLRKIANEINENTLRKYVRFTLNELEN